MLLSVCDTERGGMRAILATTSSISGGRISSGRSAGAIRRTLDPASSMTSMALSGRCEPLMWRDDSSTAATSAASVYLTPWWAS